MRRPANERSQQDEPIELAKPLQWMRLRRAADRHIRWQYRSTMAADIPISSRDYWFKVVDMLQQNWALVDGSATGSVVVYFIGDTSGVFDQLQFHNESLATNGLLTNGFRRLSDDPDAQSFLVPPAPPFSRRYHPSGSIYSSGRFWKS